MISCLPVKIKEEMMSLKMEMENLRIAIDDVSQCINAMELMAMGLLYAQGSYADGFNALSAYLMEVDREVHKHLTTCLNSI